uniref:Cytochrome c oxidase assembly protein COX16, mitochondrial n=1 Tax=Araucaria cunninghamii TaxID=56994 RepID=A0A0D6R4W4_ARACU
MDSKLESFPGATTQGTAKHSMTTQQASKSANYKRWVSKNPFLRFGLPLISLTILGAIGLGHLQQGRKDMQKAREDSEWEAIKITKALSREGPLGKYMKPKSKQINLEDELKALHQKIDINKFEYKKIPRPNERE